MATDNPVNPNDKLDHPSTAYKSMCERWELLHDLLGGTLAMRKARTKWLPMEPREVSPAYEARLGRSILYGAYADTVEKLAAKPFSKAVSLEETGAANERLELIAANVDGIGTDLTNFGKELLKAAVTYGLTHILVDYPAMDPNATLADERASGAQPTFVHVKPPDLIGWKSELVNGSWQLSEIRIKECRTEPDGQYGDREVPYIRVYRRTTWEVWKKDKEGENYSLEADGTHTFGAVPLVTCYINQTGLLTANPPLEDLAWLNLAHWQSESDHRNNLRFARIGLLFGAGFSQQDQDKGLTIGPTQIVWSTNSDAKLQYVEHSGKAIEAGLKDLDRLEARMEVQGLQPLVERSSTSTATGKGIDEARSTCAIQSWIQNLEKALHSAFEMAAQWLQLKLPPKFRVNIFNEFSITAKGAVELDFLLKARLAGEITQETFLSEVKRRAVLSETFDVSKEVQQTEEANDIGLTEGDDGNENRPKVEPENGE